LPKKEAGGRIPDLKGREVGPVERGLEAGGMLDARKKYCRKRRMERYGSSH